MPHVLDRQIVVQSLSAVLAAIAAGSDAPERGFGHGSF
jgi:hypothetical protein